MSVLRLRLRAHAGWLAVTLGVASLLILVIGSNAGASTDDEAIRELVTRAMHLQQEVGLPPPEYAGGPMQPEMVAEMVAQGRDELAGVFAEPELDVRTQVLQVIADDAKYGEVRYLGAGVKDIDISEVTIDGDTAQVHATAIVWADVAQVQGGGKLAVAHPENTIVYDMTLQKVNGTWLISSESMGFAPGSEP